MTVGARVAAAAAIADPARSAGRAEQAAGAVGRVAALAARAVADCLARGVCGVALRSGLRVALGGVGPRVGRAVGDARVLETRIEHGVRRDIREARVPPAGVFRSVDREVGDAHVFPAHLAGHDIAAVGLHIGRRITTRRRVAATPDQRDRQHQDCPHDASLHHVPAPAPAPAPTPPMLAARNASADAISRSPMITLLAPSASSVAPQPPTAHA